MKKVSVIVAIYKSENFLRKLLDSIVSQTWRNLEIILVDDGSPDRSGEICDEYASRDDRIQVVHKENSGACEARNDGLKIATGEYVVIVDGDDWLELDFVEYLMNLIYVTGSEMALTDKIFTTRDRAQTEDDHIETWSAEDATAAILYPKMEVGPWNKIYKVSLLRDNGITFSRPWSGEGLHFASTASQYANRVGVGHRKIYNYRLNNVNSGLTNYNVQMGLNAFDNIKYIEQHLHLKTSKIENAVNCHIWRNYWYLLFLIIATHSEREYADRYGDCLLQLRLRLPGVLIRSDVSLNTKVRMLAMGLFPIVLSKIAIRRREKALVKDTMR